jgi:hypothetical protein
MLSVEGTVVLRAVMPAKLGVLELELNVIAEPGAMRTTLGMELCKIKVAVRVLWVFGRAPDWLLHIVYAFTTTSSRYLISSKTSLH